MQSTIGLIDLLGAVALLMWGLRLIKTGVLRAFGATLRLWIAKGTTNRVTAAASGFLATIGLQSSTATAVITGSFAGRGIVDPRMGQAVMLGANLGTAVVAVVLSADLHWLGSLFILAGVVTFSRSTGARAKGIGRAILGLGLMILSLKLLGEINEELRTAPAVTAVFAALNGAPLFALIAAAGFAVLGSSSLAVVIFVMLLAQGGVVQAPLALAMVAGANLGGAIPPWLAVANEGAGARRLTLANLMVRAAGALVVTAAAGPLAALVARVFPDPAQAVVWSHVGFNIALLVVFLPLIGPVGRLVDALVPEGDPEGAGGPAYLDESLLSTPPLALAVAARETLRLGDLVAQMLERTETALRNSDEGAAHEVVALETQVDRLHEAIKLYVARLSRGEMDEEDTRRANEIISYAINLEHVGDIIDSGLVEGAEKKIRRRLSLSPEGMGEISSFFAETLANLRLAQAIFLSRDPALARQLIDSKIAVRKIEADSAERHLARMRAGRAETLETSTIHLDMLRDLKRVNAHLASVAHPILEEIGVLGESRLRPAE
ncbi:MAG: Na/Pi cotransporter family protein [Paracoccaceae bacterium]